MHLLGTFVCSTNHPVGLVSELRGESAVRFEHLPRAKDFFPIASGMSCDLGGFLAVVTGFLQIFANLLATWAGRVQVFLGVALDLRRTTTARFKFVAKLPQTIG